MTGSNFSSTNIIMPSDLRNFKNKEIREKAIKSAHTPEAMKKMVKTRSENIILKEAILGTLKNELLASKANKSTSYYENFITSFLKEASDPNSKCGQMLASKIITDDIIDKLDESVNESIARDLDFIRYRVIKNCITKQQEVILSNDPSKVITVLAGRRAGKTTGAARLLVYRSITPNSPAVYVNKTFQMAVSQIWKPINDVADEVGLEIDKADTSTGLITFKNGSSILVKGNNDSSSPDTLQGFKFRTIIIDEAQSEKQMSYLVDTILRPTMADFTDSVMILQGSPPRVPHTYFEKQLNNENIPHFFWNFYSNKFIKDPDKIIEEVCKEKGVNKDSPLIRREYFGDIVYDTEAQVFKGYKVFKTLPEEFHPTDILIGVDFGFSDNNAVVSLEYNKATKQAYITRVDKFNKSTVTDIVNKIKEHYAEAIAKVDKDRVEILCDNNESSIVYELSQNYKLPAFTCYKYDKQFAISKMAEDLRTGRIETIDGCPLVDEFEMTVYKRDEGTDAILPEIDDDQYHPDAVFALLYAYRQYLFDIGAEGGGESSSKAATEGDIVWAQ